MDQLTVRGIDDELKDCLQRMAAEQGISMNQAALKLLRKAARMERLDGPIDWEGVKTWKGSATPPASLQATDPVLAGVVGSMTAEEADAIDAAIEEMFETVDEPLWR